ATGELLHIGLFGVASESPHQLEESEDSGQHWTTISTPLDFTAIVSPAVAGQPWRICGTRYGSPQTDILMCSMDGGKTWTQRPQYDVTVTNPSNQQYLESANEVAVGPDGTVYATMGAIPPAALYRLVPGSDRWQSLGPLPQGQNAATAELPGAGIFWFNTVAGLPLYNP
ncbi:MAG: hypothetical protein ACLQUY_23620, partial [Ktedonobacterales bacterium]